jgi:Cysteine-rich CPCC
MAIQTESTPQFPCHCCGFLTQSDPATGSYEICPVCFWADDLVQNEDPEYVGGSNKVSLNAARENYVQFGACEPDFVGDVRPPEIGEVPGPTVVPGANDSRPISRRVKIILLGVVRAMLSGAISVLDGCSAIAATAWALNDAQIEEQLRFSLAWQARLMNSQRGRLVIFGHQMPLPSKISEPPSIRRESRARS